MATAQHGYYEVLGVPRDADEKEIKAAFRQLALRFHADRNQEPGAEERFKEIAEAYAVLSDPRKRAEHDSHGFAGAACLSPEDLFVGIDFGDLFRCQGSDLGFDIGGGTWSAYWPAARRRSASRGPRHARAVTARGRRRGHRRALARPARGGDGR